MTFHVFDFDVFDVDALDLDAFDLAMIFGKFRVPIRR